MTITASDNPNLYTVGTVSTDGQAVVKYNEATGSNEWESSPSADPSPPPVTTVTKKTKIAD